MDSFVIRTYGRTELAQIYCPNLCPEAAFRKLKHWIDLCPDLRDGLSALGGSSRSRSYTPAPSAADSGCTWRALNLRLDGVKVRPGIVKVRLVHLVQRFIHPFASHTYACVKRSECQTFGFR